MKHLLLIAFSARLFATTYYVSSTGSDSNNGFSSSTPWQTITKVNAGSYSAGDSILFNGGNTFSGTVALSLTGTQAARITIGSYGTGNATISSGNAEGIQLGNSEFVTIQNLTVTGTSTTDSSTTGSGIHFLCTRSTGNPLRSNMVTGVAVSGYLWGVTFDTRSSASLVGFQGVTITNDSGADNALVFIQGFGSLSGGPTNQITDVYIGYNTVLVGGGCADISNITGVTFERNFCGPNVASGPGPNGGYCSFALSNSRNFRIQNNELTGATGQYNFDSCAIDLDQDTQNGEIAYNLTWNNVGPSIQIGSFTGKTTGTVRVHHNISFNDVRGYSGFSPQQGAFRLWGNTNGVSIFNNSVYLTASGTVGQPSCVSWEVGSNTNVVIADNIFKVAGNVPFYWAATNSNATHLGAPITLNNLYDVSGGTFQMSNDNGTAYTTISSLSAWQAIGSGFENLTGITYGVIADSGMSNPSAFVAPSGGFFPQSKISNFNLSVGSAAIGAGVDPWIEAADLGPIDFQSNYARHGAPVDIGANSYLATSSTPSLIFRGGNIAR